MLWNYYIRLFFILPVTYKNIYTKIVKLGWCYLNSFGKHTKRGITRMWAFPFFSLLILFATLFYFSIKFWTPSIPNPLPLIAPKFVSFLCHIFCSGTQLFKTLVLRTYSHCFNSNGFAVLGSLQSKRQNTYTSALLCFVSLFKLVTLPHDFWGSISNWIPENFSWLQACKYADNFTSTLKHNINSILFDTILRRWL